MLKKQRSKFILKLIGMTLLCVSLIYLHKTFAQLDYSIINVFLKAEHVIILSIVSIILYLIVLIIGAYIWSDWILTLEGKNNYSFARYLQLVAVYYVANIQKYIPGNVFQFLGRNLLGSKIGYSHKSIISSSVLEMVLSIFAGILMLLFMAPLYFDSFKLLIKQPIFEKFSVLMVSTILLVLLGTILVVFRSGLKHLNFTTYFRTFNSKCFLYIILFVITFVLLGVINAIFLTQLFDVPISLSNFGILVFGFTVSWLVGFIVPGAPGGIGIREAVFLIIMNGVFIESHLFLIVVLVRFVGLISELLFFVLGWLYLKKIDFNTAKVSR